MCKEKQNVCSTRLPMKESNLLFCEENSAGIKISETTLQDLNIAQIIRAIQEGDSFYQDYSDSLDERIAQFEKELQYYRLL